VPVNGWRQGNNAIEQLAVSFRHFMTFATAVGASDEVVPVVLLPVIGFCDRLAPQMRVMLTTPSVIHDAAVIDCAIGIQTKRGAAFARRNLDCRGGRIRIGTGA